jgi:hypothetical protein
MKRMPRMFRKYLSVKKKLNSQFTSQNQQLFVHMVLLTKTVLMASKNVSSSSGEIDCWWFDIVYFAELGLLRHGCSQSMIWQLCRVLQCAWLAHNWSTSIYFHECWVTMTPSPLASISTLSLALAGTLNVNVNVSDRPTGSDSMNHNPSLLISCLLMK